MAALRWISSSRVGSCRVFIANTFFSSHQQSVLCNTDCWCDEKKSISFLLVQAGGSLRVKTVSIETALLDLDKKKNCKIA